jgi:hypothetical protein
LGTNPDSGTLPQTSIPDEVLSDAFLMDEECQIQNIELPACALSLSWNIGMPFMFALSQDRNDPQDGYQNR